jgi:nitroreductase
MQLNSVLSKRCSTREFSNKKVPIDLIIDAIDAACSVPFAGNINNLTFLIVEDQKMKSRLTVCCQQDWIAEAPYLVVVCSDDSKLERLYYDRGLDYSKQQSGAAINTFLLKIVDLGLASCWVGAYSDEIIKQCLKIPENINIEAILPVGYRAKACRSKQAKKKALDTVLRWENWNNRQKPRK